MVYLVVIGTVPVPYRTCTVRDGDGGRKMRRREMVRGQSESLWYQCDGRMINI
jgi:hypothetical protein